VAKIRQLFIKKVSPLSGGPFDHAFIFVNLHLKSFFFTIKLSLLILKHLLNKVMDKKKFKLSNSIEVDHQFK